MFARTVRYTSQFVDCISDNPKLQHASRYYLHLSPCNELYIHSIYLYIERTPWNTVLTCILTYHIRVLHLSEHVLYISSLHYYQLDPPETCMYTYTTYIHTNDRRAPPSSSMPSRPRPSPTTTTCDETSTQERSKKETKLRPPFDFCHADMNEDKNGLEWVNMTRASHPFCPNQMYILGMCMYMTVPPPPKIFNSF